MLFFCVFNRYRVLDKTAWRAVLFMPYNENYSSPVMPMSGHLRSRVGQATLLYLYFIADGPLIQYILEIDTALLLYKARKTPLFLK